MFVKIENNSIKFPPHNCGNKINVHLDPEWLSENGYKDMTREEISQIRNENIEPKKEQTVFSKLAIRRAMRELLIEYKLNELLNSSETFRNDWQDAQEINLNDNVLLEALGNGGISKYEIETIKNFILSEENHDSI